MGEKWSSDGVVMDSYDRSAATANVKHMLRIMDQAAKPNQANDVGFDEDRIVDLYRLWLIVGSWMRTLDYAKIYGPPMAMLRAPRPSPSGAKHSTLLHVALKQLAHLNENDNDTKHRRSAFDLAQDRMQDFIYAFHTALAKQSQTRANAFRQKLDPIPTYVRVHYTKHWS